MEAVLVRQDSGELAVGGLLFGARAGVEQEKGEKALRSAAPVIRVSLRA